MQTKILDVKLKGNYRLIAISDIHGSLDLFKELLEKVEYKPTDYLFILGDMIEKGRQNAETLLFMYELAKKENVYIIGGNVDRWAHVLLESEDREKIFRYFKNRPVNTIAELAKLCGYEGINAENCDPVSAKIRNTYKDQIEWLKNLPVAIETEDFIFVHAGLQNIPSWRESEDHFFVKQEFFAENGHQTGKWVVVGHMPTYNYAQAGLTCNPVVNYERKIISIDGGNNVRYGGQLNAFVITKSDGNFAFKCDSVDKYPKASVRQDVAENIDGYIKNDYRHPQIEILEKGEYFSTCRMLKNGKAGLLKNEQVMESENGFYTYRCLSNFIGVKLGETVSVIDDTCSGFTFVRNQFKQVGWIPKGALHSDYYTFVSSKGMDNEL